MRYSRGEDSFFSGLGAKILDAFPGKIRGVVEALWALISGPFKAVGAFWDELLSGDPDTSWVERILNAFSAAFDELIEGFKTSLTSIFGPDFFEPFLDLWDVLTDFEPSMEWLNRLITTWYEGFKQLFGNVVSSLGEILYEIAQELIRFNPATFIARKAMDFVGWGRDEEEEPEQKPSWQIAGEQLAQAGQSPLNSQTSSAISNYANSSRQQNISVGDINIATQASDPQAVGAFAGDAVNRALRLDDSFASGEDR